jgi:ubiquinone/menaquinone biosynthesis C-methylase UbiE
VTGRENKDAAVVEGFGDEWSRFDQTALSVGERAEIFESYFSVFPWDELPADARGIDVGCGSGRWAALVGPRVGDLLCVDASPAAAEVAARALAAIPQCRVVVASVDELPVDEGMLDFAYTLGVLHHVPDTQAGLDAVVRTVKPGSPVLVYLYYDFNDRPAWFRQLWRTSDLARRVVSRSPHGLRWALSQLIALLVYWPLARAARVAERAGREVDGFPLSFYRCRSFYVMRTDALDRFGTRLEQRFSRDQIVELMMRAGLRDVVFREDAPYWVAMGRRA